MFRRWEYSVVTRADAKLHYLTNHKTRTTWTYKQKDTGGSWLQCTERNVLVYDISGELADKVWAKLK